MCYTQTVSETRAVSVSQLLLNNRTLARSASLSLSLFSSLPASAAICYQMRSEMWARTMGTLTLDCAYLYQSIFMYVRKYALFFLSLSRLLLGQWIYIPTHRLQLNLSHLFTQCYLNSITQFTRLFACQIIIKGGTVKSTLNLFDQTIFFFSSLKTCLVLLFVFFEWTRDIKTGDAFPCLSMSELSSRPVCVDCVCSLPTWSRERHSQRLTQRTVSSLWWPVRMKHVRASSRELSKKQDRLQMSYLTSDTLESDRCPLSHLTSLTSNWSSVD